MAYIFLDESGDLGFSKNSSKWFMITIAISEDKKCFERVVKKVWRLLQKKHKHLGELHASHEKDITRTRILNMLAVCDIKVMAIILNKEKVHIELKNQKNYLYNHAANILLENLHNKDIIQAGEGIDLVVDRKDTKKSLQENFVNFLTESMSKRRKEKFEITLNASHEDKSLQAVDFISWAIFKKYEHGDFEFYEIIKNKIIDEKLLFPPRKKKASCFDGLPSGNPTQEVLLLMLCTIAYI